MASNEYKITDIIDQSAFDQIEKGEKALNSFAETYVKITKELDKEIKINVTGFEELNKKGERFAEILQQAQKIGGQYNIALQEQEQVIKKTSHAIEEHTRVLKEETEVTNEYNKVKTEEIKISKEVNELVEETLGTREEVIRGLLREQANINQLNKEYKELTSEVKRGNTTQAEAAKKRIEITSQINQSKQAISEYNQILRTQSNLNLQANGSDKEREYQLDRLNQAYKRLNESQKQSAAGTELLTVIQQLDKAVKENDATIGRHQKNVGNYPKFFNSFENSVRRVTRDLPTLSANSNTFFNSLRYNIPALSSNLQKIRQENALLAAQGQKTIPIWKLFTRSIFSWQSALLVALTVLVTYRKEIAKYLSDLLNTDKSLKAVIKAEKQLSEARHQGAANAAKEASQLKVLYEASQDENRSREERFAAIDKLKKEYPGYFGDLSNEEILTGNAADAYERLASQILASARARALQGKVDENATKIVENETKIEDLTKEIEKEINAYNQFYKVNEKGQREYKKGVSQATLLSIAASDNRIAQRKKEIKEIKENNKELEDINNKLAESIVISDLTFDTKEDKAANKKKEQEAERYAKYMLKIENDLAAARAKIIKDAQEREVATIQANYQKRISEIKGNSEKEKELRSIYEQEMNEEIADINYKYETNAEKQRLEIRLKEIQGNSQEEVAERLKLTLELNKILHDAAIREAKKQGKDIQSVNAQFELEERQAREKAAAQSIKLIQEEAASQSLIRSQEQIEELKTLEESYQQRNITRSQYEREQREIQQRYARIAVQDSIDLLETLLETEELSAEERLKIDRKLYDTRIQLSNLATQQEIEDLKRSSSAWQDWVEDHEEVIDKLQDLYSGLTDFVGTIFDNQINALNDQLSAIDEAYNEQIENIDKLAERDAISSEEAEARKRAAAAKTAEERKETEKQIAALQTRQAKYEKANSIIQAVINTALAITKVWGQAGIFGAPMATIVAAVGAAQIATISAQKIPKYKEGTDSHPGGLAFVGDGGRKEVISIGGKNYLTPNKATLVDLPKGSKVYPSEEVFKELTSHYYSTLNAKVNQSDDPSIIINGDNSRMERMLTENNKYNKMMLGVMRSSYRNSLFAHTQSHLKW